MATVKDSITVWGVTFEVVAEAEKFSPGRREGGVPIEPDEPASCEVVSVKVRGSDQELIEVLQQSVIDDIEEYIMQPDDDE